MDNLTKEMRSKVMRSIKTRDTKPELVVRRLVFSLGFHYRVGDGSLPGRPDLVFRSKRKVIFVHGCFWHVHTKCALSHIPAYSFWREKLERNRQRDRSTKRMLRRLGWQSLVIWECQLERADKVTKTILQFLTSRSGS